MSPCEAGSAAWVSLPPPACLSASGCAPLPSRLIHSVHVIQRNKGDNPVSLCISMFDCMQGREEEGGEGGKIGDMQTYKKKTLNAMQVHVRNKNKARCLLMCVGVCVAVYCGGWRKEEGKGREGGKK